MFVTMFRGFVSALFFSFTGTSGYSSGAGSVSSHQQSYCSQTALSASSSGAVSQPDMHTTESVPTKRSAASAFWISAVIRSMQSFRSSLRGA